MKKMRLTDVAEIFRDFYSAFLNILVKLVKKSYATYSRYTIRAID